MISPTSRRTPARASMERLIDRNTILLMVCIGVLIFALAFLILLHQNITATKGYRLRTLERERSHLLLEEEVLQMQVAEAQSLAAIQSDGKVQAMISIKKPTFAK